MTHAADQERAEFLQMHADFEREFGPMPQDCKWSGTGFYQTSHHAWKAQEYAHKFDGFKAAWQAARRAPAAPVPQGWQPVPIEPTQEMQDAMHTTGHAPTRYAAMLAAAPQPPEADHIPDAGKMVAAPVQLPENLREGAPYDNPAFEALARALGVWGTAQSAVCAQFWIAAKEQST